MPYDDQGNYVEDSPALDFAVQSGGGGAPTGGAPTGGAPNSNLAVTPELAAYAAANPDLQKEAARTVGTGQFATPADYYAWHQQTFGNEGRGGVPGLAVRTSTGAVDTTPINNNTSPSLSVYDPSQGQQYDEYGSPIYTSSGNAYRSYAVPENYGNPKNKIYQLSAAPDEKVRLVGLDGTVYYEGVGDDGAAKAADLVQRLGKEFNTGATWILQKQAPGSGGWQQVSQDTVGKQKTTALNSFLNVALPIAGSFIPGVGPVIGAMLGSGLNSALQSKSLETAFKDAVISAAAAYVGGKIPIGAQAAAQTASQAASQSLAQTASQAANEALAQGLTGAARDAFVQRAVDGAFKTAVQTAGKTIVQAGTQAGAQVVSRGVEDSLVQEVVVQGVRKTVSKALAQQLIAQGAAQAVESTLPKTDTPNTTNTTIPKPVLNPNPTQGEIDELIVTARKNFKVGLDPATATRAVMQGITQATLPEWLGRQGYDTSTMTPAEEPKPTGPLTKVTDWVKAHPALSAQLGVAGLTALKSVLGGNGSGGGGTGTGGGFKTIEQQRAGLPDIFRAQLGAPRGMFSALGSAGTPYTPRPISNLIPDAAVNTNGSGNPNPSGTAALSDYLRRYPDVAAEAKANPGAYDDVNEDGVIDDNDFALMHYILHGEAEGRTMNVKKGGYIQHPSRDTDMHNSRFQVMRKADGGVINDPVASAGDTFSSDDFVPRNTTSSSAASMMGPLNQPVPSQLAQSLAVDPRALAESYRSGTVAPPSVMQQRQSPYSGYEPGTMGGMYHYGESPAGETQHYNYALAQGSVAPWMASTPTGTGRYNMFGVLMNDGVGTGVGGGGTPGTTTGGTPGTTTGGTPGTTTTNTPTPISAAERAKWTAYVNAYPDLAKAFAENSAAYKDFNNDGKVDIADFGLGHYSNYGQKEGRPLTGPAATTTGTTTTDTTVVPLPRETAEQARQRAADEARNASMLAEYLRQQTLGLDTPGGGYQVYGQPDPSIASFTEYLANNRDVAEAAQNPVTGMAAIGDANRDGQVTPEDYAQWHYLNYGVQEGRAYDDQYKKGGAARSQFAVRGPGTGRSDSIPAALSDGEYVMDAETVALLGDGSSKAGAKKLDAMRGNLRKHKGRSLAKGRFSVNAKAPEAYLSGGRT